MAEDPPHPLPGSDVVLLTGPTEDGEGIRVVRARDERLEAGEVRPLKEGKPLGGGEIVKLAPREGAPRVCDVQVLTKLGPDTRGSGPPQVATSAYRESWERIFGVEEDPRALN
jgi:hypothetical protein